VTTKPDEFSMAAPLSIVRGTQKPHSDERKDLPRAKITAPADEGSSVDQVKEKGQQHGCTGGEWRGAETAGH
jgi:hypothetical protein